MTQTLTRKQKFAKLQERYTKELPAKMEKIYTIVNSIQLTETKEGLELLHFEMHTLAGTGGTFGYKKLGNLARKIEQRLLEKTQKETSEKDVYPVKNITEDIKQLFEISQQGADCLNRHTSSLAKISKQALTADFPDCPVNSPLVYLIEDDLEAAKKFSSQLQKFCYRVKHFDSIEALLSEGGQEEPDAFLLDIVFPEGPLVGTSIAPELRNAYNKDIPIIFISGRSDWEARLATIRCGGVAYFTKPIEYFSLVDYLDRLLGKDQSTEYRILLVDDNCLLAEHYALVLESADMRTQVVNDPSNILDALEDFSPDLVVMDLYMPGCNGIEAAKIIRQHDRYQGLPIVFLSTEAIIDTQMEAMKTGGDDFLQKPIEDQLLITAVQHRAERFSNIKRMMTCDGLTGLLNHVSFKSALDREFAIAERNQTGLCLAIIDIDLFKSVNDTYGHRSGDRVLKALSRLLQQRTRKTDIIARYGGEEFAIILPNVDTHIAASIIDFLRRSFSELLFSNDTREFSCTLSAGLACSSIASDSEALFSLADKALYEAKNNGRNRIEVVQPLENDDKH